MTKQRLMTYILFGAIALLITSCATTDSNTTAGGDSPEAVQKGLGLTSNYLEFGDVLVPTLMEIVPDASFVYSASGLTVGIMTLRGRVEMESLIAFFQNNMPKDNWKMVSIFKSPKTILLFRKETRWSVIRITEETYYTYAEVWLAPTADNVDTRVLK